MEVCAIPRLGESAQKVRGLHKKSPRKAGLCAKSSGWALPNKSSSEGTFWAGGLLFGHHIGFRLRMRFRSRGRIWARAVPKPKVAAAADIMLEKVFNRSPGARLAN